jgi:fucose permease
MVQNLVLGVAMLVFVPVFFFGSEYAQIALAKSANEAGIILLFFFIGFFVTAQIGGRMLDRRGAKPPVVMGCALAAVGFYLWAENVTKLSFGSVQWPIILSGAGIGFMLGPSSTDAVNRASKLSYGEATGITQTIRNYSASLGLAILGTILVSQFRSQLITSFVARGVPHSVASVEATTISQSQGGSSGSTASIPHYIRLDFADATRTVFYVMAGIMVVATIIAVVGLQRGVQSDPTEVSAEEPAVAS